MLSILIISYKFLERSGLKQLLREELREVCIGEAYTAEDGQRIASKACWDLTVLSMPLRETDGMPLLSWLCASEVKRRVLVLTTRGNQELAARAVKQGAYGCFPDDSNRIQVVQAIRDVLTGKRLAGSWSGDCTSQSDASLDGQLSSREEVVLRGLASGKPLGELAEQMSLSPKTVSIYKRRVMSKLRLESKEDLLRYAIGLGLAKDS